MWLWWVAVSLQQAFPGLIDDGSHMTVGKNYAVEGFFPSLVRFFRSFLDGERFYETQYSLLGLYTIFFGEKLVFWYAGNIFLGALASGSIGYVIYSETKNLWASLMGTAIMLTSSPVAEALRANFGKAEAIMVALFAVGLAFWAHSAHSKRPLIWIIGAVILVALGCVSKESGKIMGVAICLPWIATWIPLPLRYHDQNITEHRGASLLGLFICGVSGTFISYLVSLPSLHIQYIRSYFQLDYSIRHIKSMLLMYIYECPDLFLIATLLLLLYVGLLWVYWNRNRMVLFGAACFTGVAAYFLGLLGFKFHCQYYLYVPLALLALSAGFAVASIPPKRGILWGVVFAIFFMSRIYSVPYLFMITRAQQLFDSVNYEAMLRTKDPSQPITYALDITEDSQIVQEWNLIRQSFTKANGISIFYGAGSGFEAWYYQDMIRNDPKLVIKNPVKLYERDDKWRKQIPVKGDILTYRFGKIVVGKHYLRAVMPFDQDATFLLSLIDRKAIAYDGAISESTTLWDPYFFKRHEVTYGWKFYTVIRPLGYILQWCTADHWMTPDAKIWIPDHSPYSEIHIEMNVPQGNTFPFTVWAESENNRIAETIITAPGKAILTLPIRPQETLKLHSSSWFQPSKKGLGKDDRELSVRFMNIETM